MYIYIYIPISKKQLVNYLENFKVSELKQLSKYFNVPVTRQNGGGNCSKKELVWNLVGGLDWQHRVTAMARLQGGIPPHGDQGAPRAQSPPPEHMWIIRRL